MSEDCIFCKIVDKKIPSDILYEDHDFIVFKDINPKAAVHLLIIPKKHIESLNATTISDQELLGKMMLLLPEIAHDQGLATGFRTIINTDKGGGQEVFHLHAHLLGGKNLAKFNEVN